MKYLLSLLIILLLWLIFRIGDNPSFVNEACIFCDQDKRVAIVGSGIGGSSTAFFLRQLFGNKVNIYIYEKEDLCGRLFITEFKNEVYELGIWDFNGEEEYVEFFTKKFRKLTYEEEYNNQAIYDESKFRTGLFPLIMDIIYEIITYIHGIVEARLFVLQNELQYSSIVENLKKKYVYLTIQEIVEENAPNMEENLREQIKDKLLEFGVPEYFYEKVLKAFIRQYNGFQDSSHVFAGLKSLKKSVMKKISIYGGTRRLCESILRASESKVIYEKVDAIYTNDLNKFQLFTNNGLSIEYDSVIIAVPLGQSISEIDFHNFPEEIKLSAEYEKLYYTIAEGYINETYFNDVKFAQMLTLNNTELFTAIYKLKDTFNREKIYPFPLWKIVSKKPLEMDELRRIFFTLISIKQENKITLTPSYKNLTRNVSFVLSQDVYYVNAAEWLDPSIDTLMMGANNVANMVFHSLISGDKEFNVQKEIQKKEVFNTT